MTRRLVVGGLVAITGAQVAAQCTPEWLPGQAGNGLNNHVFATTLWDPDGAGPQPPQVVVGGSFSSAGGVSANSIARWNGSTWQPLGSGTGTVLARYCSRVIGAMSGPTLATTAQLGSLVGLLTKHNVGEFLAVQSALEAATRTSQRAQPPATPMRIRG